MTPQDTLALRHAWATCGTLDSLADALTRCGSPGLDCLVEWARAAAKNAAKYAKYAAKNAEHAAEYAKYAAKNAEHAAKYAKYAEYAKNAAKNAAKRAAKNAKNAERAKNAEPWDSFATLHDIVARRAGITVR